NSTGSKGGRKQSNSISLFLLFSFTILPVEFSSAQPEAHGDLRLDLDRFIVQTIRAVVPLPHRIERGRGEHRMAAQHAQLLYGTVAPNDRREHDLAFYAGGDRHARIRRLHLALEIAARHALRDNDARRSRGIGPL